MNTNFSIFAIGAEFSRGTTTRRSSRVATGSRSLALPEIIRFVFSFGCFQRLSLGGGAPPALPGIGFVFSFGWWPMNGTGTSGLSVFAALRPDKPGNHWVRFFVWHILWASQVSRDGREGGEGRVPDPGWLDAVKKVEGLNG